MDKNRDVALQERTFLSIHFTQCYNGTSEGIVVDLELAGRDGFQTRRWLCRHGIPGSQAATDIEGYVQSVVRTALLDFVGVQELLEG